MSIARATFATLASQSPAEAQHCLEGVGAAKLQQVFAPAPGEWGAMQAATLGLQNSAAP